MGFGVVGPHRMGDASRSCKDGANRRDSARPVLWIARKRSAVRFDG